MKYLYCIIIFSFMLLSACEDDTSSQLTTSVTQMTFTTLSGSSTFEINSNTDWRITSSDDWISVTPAFGSGNQSVTVTVAVDDNLFDRTAKIVICTKDGEKVVNVDVKVKGTKSDKEKYLDVKNHTTRLYMDGKAGSEDSLVVRSNFKWEIKGPEWIEVWDGVRWRSLLHDRGVIKGNGTQTVLLRTAENNKDEERLEDVIKICEYLTGENTYTLNVFQMGRMETHPDVLFTSPTGAVFGWKCGCDVEKIYFKVTEDINESIKGSDNIRASLEVTDVNYLNSVDGLPSGCAFMIISCGEDFQGQLGKKVYYIKTSTYEDDQVVNSNNLPYNPIIAVYQMSEKNWRIIAGIDESSPWYIYMTNSTNSAFMYNDQIMRYLFFVEAPKSIRRGYSIMNWNCTFAEETNEIHVYLTISGKVKHIYRYDRYYDDDGKRLPDMPLLNRIPIANIYDSNLRPILPVL